MLDQEYLKFHLITLLAKNSSGSFKAFSNAKRQLFVLSTQDAGHIEIKKETVDYVFIDPPFGANLNYSELNCLWESWMKLPTDNTNEAIENNVQGKGSFEYRQLMTTCFAKAYHV